MTTSATQSVHPSAPASTRRSWLQRLGAVLGGTLLGGPALARTLSRPPVDTLGLAPFIGEIALFPFDLVPKGYAPCNGQLLPINQNQALFSLLGPAYGGNGTTTFALPDLRGRVPLGMGSGYAIGQKGGSDATILTTSTLPAHTHAAQASSAPATSSSPIDKVPAVPTGTNLNGEAVTVLAYSSATSGTPMATTATGSPAPVSVVTTAPFLTLNFCIALVGIFPSRD